MEQRTSLAEIIEYIDPGSLSYQDWVNVGMALKLEGYPISVWDQWSQKDFSRYHSGECERKWRTFSGSSSPVTGGTIVQMAIEHGWVPERGHLKDGRAQLITYGRSEDAEKAFKEMMNIGKDT